MARFFIGNADATLSRYFPYPQPAPSRFAHRQPTNLPNYFPAESTHVHEGAIPEMVHPPGDAKVRRSAGPKNNCARPGLRKSTSSGRPATSLPSPRPLNPLL